MSEMQGRIVALTLLLLVCLPISYSAYRFAMWGRRHEDVMELWTASAIATVDPYEPYGEASLRFRRLASRQVAADQVPAPHQVRDIYDVMRGPPIDAISIPAGVRYYSKIPVGMKIPMVAKEKCYWTDDPSTGVWWEEDWVNVATVDIDINNGVEGWVNGPISLYDYPQNIDVRMYTVAEATPVYTIRLFLVPMNLNRNVDVWESLWSPCSGGKHMMEIAYGDTAKRSWGGVRFWWDIWREIRVWRVQSFTVSATLSAVTGRTVYITFIGSIEAQVLPNYIERRIQVFDWSKAPAGTTKLAVYACDQGNTLIRAQYEG
ncbi:MAG: hypothetical protein QXI84_09845 [Thermofilaceae archaeon]